MWWGYFIGVLVPIYLLDISEFKLKVNVATTNFVASPFFVPILPNPSTPACTTPVVARFVFRIPLIIILMSLTR